MPHPGSTKTKQDHIFDLLVTFADILEGHGLRYMIAFGTLLGAYREKNILPNEYDADVIVFAPEGQMESVPSSTSRFVLQTLD